MSIVDNVKQFINSDAYRQLSDEAEHNSNALHLLEVIELSIASLIFFKENKIKNRELLEARNLNNLFTYLKEIYEEK